MSLTQLKIPKKIVVGYQNRPDTYTGKLAYVTYLDEKGKLRKERSWNGWRNDDIEPDYFDNEPTSGFVLNKKVGDESYGWNPRKAWVRIYDPRGFEFEISVANLLFILEECTSIKGKGLEGEFVYSLDGADLVLLPVSSQEYISSSQFTSLQTKKITKNDMTEGCYYMNKKGEKVMYLGRLDYYESDVSYGFGYYNIFSSYGHGSNSHRYSYKEKKKHIFVRIDTENNRWSYDRYWIQTGFTNLAEKLTDKADEQFAIEYDKYMSEFIGTPPFRLVERKAKLNFEDIRNWSHYSNYIINDEKMYFCHIEQDSKSEKVYVKKLALLEYNDMEISSKSLVDGYHYSHKLDDLKSDIILQNKESLKDLDIVDICLDNGKSDPQSIN